MSITRRSLLKGVAFATTAVFENGVKAYADSKKTYANVDSLDYFNRVAAYIDARFATQNNTSIARITTLDDLAGNTYTLVERQPYGYFILHDASGQLAEYGENAPSPYADAFGNLVYAGPGLYLCETVEGFVDLMRDKLLEGNSGDMAYQIACNAIQMHEALSNNPNYGLLEVLLPTEGNASAKETFEAIEKLQARETKSVIEYRVPDNHFFSLLNNTYCGYYCPSGSNGICGYIAANLLYRYWNYRGQVPLYSDFTSTAGVQHAYYTKFLYDCGITYFGLSDATCAWDIAGLMNGICSYYGLAQTASWAILGTDAWTEVYQNHRPVILFGTPADHGFHAFVAYGVRIDTAGGNQNWICHLGFNYNYGSVTINTSTLVGSNMKCAY